VPEITFSTVPANNNYLTLESRGNAVPTPPPFTVTALKNYAASVPPPDYSIAGYYLQIQKVTIIPPPTATVYNNSGQVVFPNYAQAEANPATEDFTITDNSGPGNTPASMEFFDDVTGNSSCGALAGQLVGGSSLNGFVSTFNGFVSIDPGQAIFTPTLIVAVPEPSPFVLTGVGLVAIRRRRC
jgi:hypothetical protein